METIAALQPIRVEEDSLREAMEQCREVMRRAEHPKDSTSGFYFFIAMLFLVFAMISCSSGTGWFLGSLMFMIVEASELDFTFLMLASISWIISGWNVLVFFLFSLVGGWAEEEEPLKKDHRFKFFFRLTTQVEVWNDELSVLRELARRSEEDPSLFQGSTWRFEEAVAQHARLTCDLKKAELLLKAYGPLGQFSEPDDVERKLAQRMLQDNSF